MRGTPAWDLCVDWGDSGTVSDAFGHPLLLVRRAHLQSGVCEVLTLDESGHRCLKPDLSGPVTHYKKYAAPLIWKAKHGPD